MEIYLIRKEDIDKYNIDITNLEKLFDYITFEDIENKLKEKGYKKNLEQLEEYSDLILKKFEGNFVDTIIEFLEYRNIL